MDERTVMKNRLGAYAFAVWEMTLYADTHPQDTCALTKRRELLEARQALAAEYEAKHGALCLTSDEAPDNGGWSWIDGPWPWECGRGSSGHVAV